MVADYQYYNSNRAIRFARHYLHERHKSSPGSELKIVYDFARLQDLVEDLDGLLGDFEDSPPSLFAVDSEKAELART